MTERHNPHELAAAHGGLFVALWDLMASKQEIVQTIWGDQGFVQVLGGVALSKGPAGEAVYEELAVAHGIVNGRIICDVHLFRETPQEGMVVERVYGNKDKIIVTRPLERLTGTIKHHPDDKLREAEIRQLTTKLEEHTQYSSLESDVAARVLLSRGVYDAYNVEDITVDRIFNENRDKPAY